MPIFRQRNVHLLKITLPSCPNFVKKTSIFSKNCAIMSFFSNWSQKIPCSHARIWYKIVNSVKTTPIYGPKKSTKYLFFPIFHNKDFSHAHILLKNIYSLKNTLFMCIYYVKKFLFSQKPNALFSFFFKFIMKNPSCHVHIWSIKRQFRQNYSILWAKK